MKKTKNNIFKGISPEQLHSRKKMAQPSFIPPMLATLTTDYFSSKEWMYEHKFDGQRCLAFKKNGKVRLMSRNDNEINTSYPELAHAFKKQTADNFIVDGEICALEKGLSDFELLQSRINLQQAHIIAERQKQIPVVFRIFDLLYVDGYDIRALTLENRKKILKKLLRYNNLLTYTEHKIGDGLTYFKKACKLGWEGLIAKRIASHYVSRRSPDWLKFKCIMKQELVIGGYTSPRRSREYFGALLVGYYDAKGRLRYAGKVGTGYTHETLALVYKLMKKIPAKDCPFSDYDGREANTHWIKPQLVAEFQFAQWTDAGKLRVGRYKGLRTDKKARDVVKEVPRARIISHAK